MKPVGNLNVAWWTLRVGLGLAPILAGLDVFFNLLTQRMPRESRRNISLEPHKFQITHRKGANNMKRMTVLLTLVLAFPAFAAAESWTNVSIVDSQCSARVKANPDAHTRSCAMACAKSGFGILTKDGQYLKFDGKGNREVMEVLQNSKKKDHLRVSVSGEREGDTIHVKTLRMM